LEPGRVPRRGRHGLLPHGLARRRKALRGGAGRVRHAVPESAGVDRIRAQVSCTADSAASGTLLGLRTALPMACAMPNRPAAPAVVPALIARLSAPTMKTPTTG